jgi:heme-degrading monooxygenase HmoA
MYIIIWQYQVKFEKQSQFERIYSSNGAWAELFKNSAGYLGTELFHDKTIPQRYLTIDRWESKKEYEAFLTEREDEYKTLDKQCEGLTESESLVGNWETFTDS